MAPTLTRVMGADNVKVLDPVMGGEDFSYFANEIPGFFFRLGMVAQRGGVRWAPHADISDGRCVCAYRHEGHVHL